MKVEIDGETFDFHTDTLSTILDCMEKTAKDGKEHGFLMCDTPKGIVPGEACTGTECSIHLKDCHGKGSVIGGFHSHPNVISFSLSDYFQGIRRAKQHPEHKHLLCVSLLNEGVRCKALKEIPSKGKLEKILPFDCEASREEVKPYFTKRVNISVEQIAKLLEGVPWKELPPAEPIIAIDEGGGPEIIKGGKAKQIKEVLGG